MPRQKKKRGSDKIPIGCLIAPAFVVILVLGAFALSGDLFAGAWEVTTQFESLEHNGHYYDLDHEPYKTVLWASKNLQYDLNPTLSGENYPVDSLTEMVTHDVLGNQLPAQEIYPPDIFGSADTIINIGNPRHVGFNDLSQTWVVTDNSIPYKTYVKPQTDGSLIRFDHHVYLFEVDFKTDADWEDVGVGTGYLGEFSNNQGVVATVVLRVDFEVDSWDIPTTTMTYQDGEYEVSTVEGWAGIMSAYVHDIDAGIISYTDYNEAPYVNPINNKGTPLNMFVDDASFTEPSGDITSITGVPQKVTIEMGCELLAGAVTTYYPLTEVVTSVAIRNVYCHYTIRVDVLTSQGFFLVTGDPPTMTTPTIIQPPPNPPNWFDLSWIGDLFAGFDPITTLFVIVIIVIVAFIGIKLILYAFRRSPLNRRSQA